MANEELRIWVCGRSSAVERLLAKEEVVGSNPIARLDAEVAQVVEHAAENRRVLGSTPSLGTG